MKRLRLPIEPVFGDSRRLLAFVPPHGVEDRRPIARSCHIAVDLSERRIVVITDAGRAGAMQIELVEEDALAGASTRGNELVPQVAPRPPVHLEIPVRVAPAEIGVEHFPREVVWKKTFDALLDEREAAQPVEELGGIAVVERRAKQRFRGDTHLRARFERPPMA